MEPLPGVGLRLRAELGLGLWLGLGLRLGLELKRFARNSIRPKGMHAARSLAIVLNAFAACPCFRTYVVDFIVCLMVDGVAFPAPF